MPWSTKPLIRTGSSMAGSPEEAVDELHRSIIQPDIAFALFYCSPTYDLHRLQKALQKTFGDVPLIGCTTAGEICSTGGYQKNSIIGVSISSPDFKVVSGLYSDLSHFTPEKAQHFTSGLLNNIATLGEAPAGNNTFGFLLIDGLSKKEESFIGALHQQMKDIQFFGGSAGGGDNYEPTYVFHEGQFHPNSAIFSLIQTRRPFEIFKTEHFRTTQQKMVVTHADPPNRKVFEINGEPAAQAYAKLMDLAHQDLEYPVLATHPVVVRIADSNFVRSIMQALPDGSIQFACAIDEGIVLSLGEPVDLIEDLSRLFADIKTRIGEPRLILGCDCYFRLVEIEKDGIKKEVGDLMKANHVFGFSTYGEQYNGMHVNQTFTGVAIG